MKRYSKVLQKVTKEAIRETNILQAFRWKCTRKIISSDIIVYYYYKALFTAVYREKKTVFSLVNAAVVRKKVTLKFESEYMG